MRIVGAVSLVVAMVLGLPGPSIGEDGQRFGMVVTTPAGVLSVRDLSGAARPVSPHPAELPVRAGDDFRALHPGGLGDLHRATGTAVTCDAAPPPEVTPAPETFCSLHDGGQRVGVTFDDVVDNDLDAPVPVLVAGAWPAHPRPVHDTTTTAAIPGLVADQLGGLGLDAADLALRRSVEADLDGDGSLEHVLALENHPSWPTPGPGAVSLVVVVHDDDAELVIVDRWDPARPDAIIHRHDIAGLVDLDGDGELELLVSSRHAGGFSLAAWKLRDRGLAALHTTGCGTLGDPDPA